MSGDVPAPGVLYARAAQPASVWHALLGERRAALALAVLLALVAFSALGPLLHPVDPNLLELSNAAAPPTTSHPLGTDESGRDILARLMHGGRVSLAVGLAAVVCSLVVGVSLGAAAGFRRGATDALLMRLTDAMLSVPTIFLIITAMTFIGPSVTGLVIAIGMTSWMGLARLVRGEILALREQLYVEASRALGARDLRIVAGHVFPHLVPSIIVNATLGVGTAILTESALSFLGLGIQPPAASWGNMLSGAQNYVYTLPWLAAWPGALIIGTVVAINVLGDVLRDVTDPHHQRTT